jgi:hypothetical protein
MNLEPVQTLWIGPMNYLIANCLSSFIKQGHSVHLYCYDDPPDIPKDVKIYSADDILPKKILQQNVIGEGKGSYAAFSDLFRFALLYQRGGWWIDADMFCLRPFVAQNSHVVATEHDSIGTCVIRAPSGSEILRSTLAIISQIRIEDVAWSEYKDIYASVVISAQMSNIIQHSHVFCPIPWNMITHYVRTEYVPTFEHTTLGVHLWHEVWRREKLMSLSKRYLTFLLNYDF